MKYWDAGEGEGGEGAGDRFGDGPGGGPGSGPGGGPGGGLGGGPGGGVDVCEVIVIVVVNDTVYESLRLKVIE
jgi:hypothetical protein